MFYSKWFTPRWWHKRNGRGWTRNWNFSCCWLVKLVVVNSTVMMIMMIYTAVLGDIAFYLYKQFDWLAITLAFMEARNPSPREPPLLHCWLVNHKEIKQNQTEKIFFKSHLVNSWWDWGCPSIAELMTLWKY